MVEREEQEQERRVIQISLDDLESSSFLLWRLNFASFRRGGNGEVARVTRRHART